MKQHTIPHTKQALLALLACSISTTLAAPPKSLRVNYENYSHGHNYTAANFRKDMQSDKRAEDFDRRDQIVVNYPSNATTKRLRFKFRKDEILNLGEETVLANHKSYTMQYNVRFANDWQYVKGGKLPGLAGGTTPSGGSPRTTGMSARIMWKRDNHWDKVPGGETRNYFEMYHYWRGQAIAYNNGDEGRRYGDRTYMGRSSKNTWYGMKIKVNIYSGSRRGRLECWINNTRKYNHEHTYKNSGDDWKMNRSFFHLYYGGGTPNWAPNADTHLWLDNFKVYQ